MRFAIDQARPRATSADLMDLNHMGVPLASFRPLPEGVTALRYLLLLTGILLATPAIAELPPPLVKSHWEGYIDLSANHGLPQGLPRRFDSIFDEGLHVDFAESNDGEFGKIYYPRWGETMWPITQLKVDGHSIGFCVGPDPANQGVFLGTIVNNTIRGNYAWKGKEYPFALGPPGQFKCPLHHNPQTPRPIFPYKQERISFRNGDVTLSGILSIPAKQRKYPVVLQIDGSGTHAADPEVPGNPDPDIWQWVLSDYLTRAGMATLRLDSRGVGKSTGSKDDSTIQDLAADVVAGVEFLSQRPDVNPHQIGLFGVSQGGEVAPLAASRTKKVSFVVVAGAAGIPGDENFLRQIKEIDKIATKSAGSETDRMRRYEFNQRLFELCKTDMSSEEIIAEMKKLRRPAPQHSLEA
ncbi:MAG TPA: alpha/beta fold hydrolase, partial [Tepidisphaeraceae bacterium]|nr:alpha/beta fold hydrolase [Tepidisphaeraceae bacterium]